jgi:hypothetical protein
MKRVFLFAALPLLAGCGLSRDKAIVEDTVKVVKDVVDLKNTGTGIAAKVDAAVTIAEDVAADAEEIASARTAAKSAAKAAPTKPTAYVA